MKKLIIALTLILSTASTTTQSATSNYILYGTVYNITCCECGNKYVEIIDTNGNVWTMTNVKIKDGQKVKLTMDAVNTKNIYDDEIIKIEMIK